MHLLLSTFAAGLVTRRDYARISQLFSRESIPGATLDPTIPCAQLRRSAIMRIMRADLVYSGVGRPGFGVPSALIFELFFKPCSPQPQWPRHLAPTPRAKVERNFSAPEAHASLITTKLPNSRNAPPSGSVSPQLYRYANHASYSRPDPEFWRLFRTTAPAGNPSSASNFAPKGPKQVKPERAIIAGREPIPLGGRSISRS